MMVAPNSNWRLDDDPRWLPTVTRGPIVDRGISPLSLEVG